MVRAHKQPIGLDKRLFIIIFFLLFFSVIIRARRFGISTSVYSNADIIILSLHNFVFTRIIMVKKKNKKLERHVVIIILLRRHRYFRCT